MKNYYSFFFNEKYVHFTKNMIKFNYRIIESNAYSSYKRIENNSCGKLLFFFYLKFVIFYVHLTISCIKYTIYNYEERMVRMYKNLLYDGREHAKLEYTLLGAEIDYAKKLSNHLLIITEYTSKEDINKFIKHAKQIDHTLEVVSNDAALIKELTQECLSNNIQITFIDTKDFIGFETTYTSEQIREMLENERKRLNLSGHEFSKYYRMNYMTYRSIVKLHKDVNLLRIKTLCQIANICNIHPAQIEGSVIRRRLLAHNPKLGGEC